MDVQTRKLNLIAYLAQVQDESFLVKIENLILHKKQNDSLTKRFSEDELIDRIQKSEEDFKNGKFKTQVDLEEISAKW